VKERKPGASSSSSSSHQFWEVKGTSKAKRTKKMSALSYWLWDETGTVKPK
jgi:hypothetical protein